MVSGMSEMTKQMCLKQQQNLMISLFIFNLVFSFFLKVFPSYCDISRAVLCVAARWSHCTGLAQAQVKRFSTGAQPPLLP